MREHEFPLAGLKGRLHLQVRFGHGTVRVVASDDADAGDTARVRLTPRDPKSTIIDQIAVELRGDTLAVVAPRQGGLPDLFARRHERDAIDAVIEIPAGTPTRITTVSASITIEGRVGTSDLAAGSADIVVHAVDGDMRLRSGSSTVRIDAVTGDVIARTGSGDLTLGEVGGGVSAGFGSGNLEIATAHGAVRSRAGAGDALVGAAHGDVDLTSGSGRVEIGLPAGIAARLDVHSGSGRVRTELPIDGERTGDGPSITVRARTGSGDVRLFRAAA